MNFPGKDFEFCKKMEGKIVQTIFFPSLQIMFFFWEGGERCWFFYILNDFNFRLNYFNCESLKHLTGWIKGVMQGKLIAVVYTLRTHWNQFSLGGICKQEQMHQCSFSIRGG